MTVQWEDNVLRLSTAFPVKDKIPVLKRRTFSSFRRSCDWGPNDCRQIELHHPNFAEIFLSSQCAPVKWDTSTATLPRRDQSSGHARRAETLLNLQSILTLKICFSHWSGGSGRSCKSFGSCGSRRSRHGHGCACCHGCPAGGGGEGSCQEGSQEGESQEEKTGLKAGVKGENSFSGYTK